MKYISLIFSTIALLLILSSDIYASDKIVGFLRTQQETYSHELGYSHNIVEMLEEFGTQPILIDYNYLVGKSKDKNHLYEEVKSFIQKNNITRVIIPGNYYNLDSPPYAPNTNRQDVTAILARLADEKIIHLMGICGGLQGVMYSKGIEIVKVETLTKNAKKHLISDPNPHSHDAPLHKVRINPASHLANTLKKVKVDMDANGWIVLYLPDAHSRVVNNSIQNIQKLEAAGYKVIGFSDDGMIEIIEDDLGNIYFQDHPEGLVIGHDKGSNAFSSLRDRSTQVIIQVFKNFINN